MLYIIYILSMSRYLCFGSETGLSVGWGSCSGKRLQPSPLLSSLGPNNMAHSSANLSSNVQPGQ